VVLAFEARATGTSPASLAGVPVPLSDEGGAVTVGALVGPFVGALVATFVSPLAATVAFAMPRSGLERLASALGSSRSHSLTGLAVTARGRVSLGARVTPDAGTASGVERR
jgi:hypothetical protein